MANSFWFKLSSVIQIPNILVEILQKSGYDNTISIQNLIDDRIDRVEKFVQQNLQPVLDEAYAKMSEFRFLPGHRATLLGLPEAIKKFESRTETSAKTIINSLPLSFIMKEMIETAISNADKDPKHRRYSETIQYFASYIYMHCGKACYEILSNNLPLPQANTTLNYINQKKQTVVEGKLRCEELNEYLENIGAPKIIWLSEDASGIVPKVSYHSATNQLVGLMLPIDQTGCPMPFTYVPKCPEDFVQQMKRPKSTLLYIIMAQPLKEGIQPFVLQVFGTNNSFTSHNVYQRWKYITCELSDKYGIQVAGVSTDGDSRALNCMKNTLTSIINSRDVDVLLDIKREQKISFIQDPIHIATKLRNRILKASIIMPIGKKQVSVSHLKILIHSVPKDTHGLVATDIIPEDRQNYASFEKITSPRVLNALEHHVIDSEATVIYLKMSRRIISAFTEVNLPPLDRIHLIWHSLYFFRAWRKWIEQKKSAKTYSLDRNFISNNAFTCIELNAYGILHLINKFREMNAPDLFLPPFFQSQTCEQIFRRFRSMTTINWTKINFSLLEVLNLIGRIELQNDIVFGKLMGKNVSFPRVQNRTDKIKIYPLPSDEEIKKVLMNAREQALKDALKLGIDVEGVDISRCEIRRVEIREKNNNKEDDISIELTEKESGELACSNVRDYSYRRRDIESDNRYIDIVDERGSTKTILKSSLVWLLSETKGVLSNDRLRRVQVPSTASYRKRKLDVPVSFSYNEKNQIDVLKSDEIRVGEWCFFQRASLTDILNVQRLQCHDILYGLVVGFRYIHGKTDKDKQYTLDFVPISYEGIHQERGVEVLATWYKYKCETDKTLVPSSAENSFFINMNNYIASTCAPVVIRDSTLNESSYNLHRNFIETKKLLIECSGEK